MRGCTPLLAVAARAAPVAGCFRVLALSTSASGSAQIATLFSFFLFLLGGMFATDYKFKPDTYAVEDSRLCNICFERTAYACKCLLWRGEYSNRIHRLQRLEVLWKVAAEYDHCIPYLSQSCLIRKSPGSRHPTRFLSRFLDDCEMFTVRGSIARCFY